MRNAQAPAWAFLFTGPFPFLRIPLHRCALAFELGMDDESEGLALGVLGGPASPLQAVLLALLDAGVAGYEPGLSQCWL